MSPVPAPSAKARTITVVAPRHGAQRPGTALASTIERLVRKEHLDRLQQQRPAGKKKSKKTTIAPQPLVTVRSGYARKLATSEGTDPLSLAIESASDWNSLLLTARAERGPQFDVATQQFHVDKKSDLYYNPTILRAALGEDKPDPPKPSVQQQQQQSHHHPQQRPVPPALVAHSPQLVRHPQGGMPGQSPLTPHGFDPRFGTVPLGQPGGYPPGMHHAPPGTMSAPPGAQFFGAGPGGPPGMMPQQIHVHDPSGGMGFSPMHDQRRMTRGMSSGMVDGFPGMSMYGS